MMGQSFAWERNSINRRRNSQGRKFPCTESETVEHDISLTGRILVLEKFLDDCPVSETMSIQNMSIRRQHIRCCLTRATGHKSSDSPLPLFLKTVQVEIVL